MTVATGQQDHAFLHEAFLYRDAEEFLRGTDKFCGPAGFRRPFTR